ncbi:MAG: hypothetical protein AAGI48_13795 [Verrucomicrobiota bacterium]
MKRITQIALTFTAAVFATSSSNAQLLAYYGDGLLEDGAAEANLASPPAEITVSALDSFGVLAGTLDTGDDTGGDSSRITRPSFGTTSPTGPTAESSEGSEWFECRSRENQAPITPTDNYFFFTLAADPGSAIDLTSLKFDFWLSAAGAAAPEADAEAFVSVDGGGFTSVGSINATDTLGAGNAAPVSTANFDLSSITGAATVEVRICIGYTVGNDNSTSGFVQGIQLEGAVGVPATTTFPLVITPNAGTPGNYDFAWESQDNMLYDLVSSTDFSTPISTWLVWEGNSDIAGSAPENTLTDVPGGGDTTRFFAVIEKEAPPLLDEDFESGDGGFTVATTLGTAWAQGTPDSDNEFSLVIDSGNGESAGCFAVGLGTFNSDANNGYYDPNTSTILTSSVIDLTGVTAATLSFAEAYDFDTTAVAEVYVIDGSDADIGGAIYTSTDGSEKSSDWAPANGGTAIALPAGAMGQSVRIQWRFTGGNVTDFLGWYVDDVVVDTP